MKYIEKMSLLFDTLSSSEFALSKILFKNGRVLLTFLGFDVDEKEKLNLSIIFGIVGTGKYSNTTEEDSEYINKTEYLENAKLVSVAIEDAVTNTIFHFTESEILVNGNTHEISYWFEKLKDIYFCETEKILGEIKKGNTQ